MIWCPCCPAAAEEEQQSWQLLLGHLWERHREALFPHPFADHVLSLELSKRMHFNSILSIMGRLWLKWLRTVPGHAEMYLFHGILTFWDFASFQAFAAHFDVPAAGAQEREEACELLQFIDRYARKIPDYLSLLGRHLTVSSCPWQEQFTAAQHFSVGRFEHGWCSPDCPFASLLIQAIALVEAVDPQTIELMRNATQAAMQCRSEAQRRGHVEARQW